MVFFLADINSVQCYYTDRSYGIYVGPILYYQTFRCSDFFCEKRIKTREKVRTEVTYCFSDYCIYDSAYMPGIYPKTIDLCKNSVSYTHLRAHETVLDLVCRLLLEKKKK